MRGSPVHDALYQLIREEQIPQNNSKYADRLLREICLEDGMIPIRAWWVYKAVQLCSASNTAPDLRKAL